MAQYKTMTKEEMDAAAKAMAQTIADEIDADLTRVALAEMELAQKHYPQPYVVWDEGVGSYTTVTTGTVTRVATTVAGTYTLTLTPEEARAMTTGVTAGTVTLYVRPEGAVSAYASTPKTYDGLTAMECFEIYQESMRGEVGHSLTPTQLVMAKQEWANQLKSKKTK